MRLKDLLKSQSSNYDDRDWLNLLANPDKSVPQLPPEDIQLMFCGRSGLLAMTQAMEFYKVIRNFCERQGKPLDSMKAILDFGCGWGRITRCFLRDLKPEYIYGCDCIPEMIEICKRDLPRCRFYQNDATPPAPFEGESFDLIYAYSVFSHLSETTHKAWLEEFHRLLRPGAALILTTYPRDLIPDLPRLLPYPNDINVENALSDYDEGKLVHIQSGGGYNLSLSFYGWTAIPHSYIKNVWSKWYSIEQFRGNVPHVEQNMIMLIRK